MRCGHCGNPLPSSAGEINVCACQAQPTSRVEPAGTGRTPESELQLMRDRAIDAERRLRTLVKIVADAHGIPWEDSVDVALHIENAVKNARADLAVARAARDEAKAQLQTAKLEARLEVATIRSRVDYQVDQLTNKNRELLSVLKEALPFTQSLEAHFVRAKIRALLRDNKVDPDA